MNRFSQLRVRLHQAGYKRSYAWFTEVYQDLGAFIIMLSRVFDTPVADVGFNVVLGVVRQEECEKRVCMGEAEEAKKAVVYPP